MFVSIKILTNSENVLICAADLDECSRVARHGTRNEERIGCCVDLQDAKILDRDDVAPHASAHAHVFGNLSAGATAAGERSGRAFFVFLTVTAWSAVEAVTLDDTLEALPLRDRRDSDDIARDE